MTQPRSRNREAPPGYGHRPPDPYDLPQAAPYKAPQEEPYEDWYRPPGDARHSPSARGRTSTRWGALPGRFGVFLVIGSAALGALVSTVANSAPGPVLGVCLVAGTVAAALAVRPRAGYLIIPVPALAYLVAALIAGTIHDRGSDGSGAVFAINGTQWIADGFVAMATATVAAILITVVRWRRSR